MLMIIIYSLLKKLRDANQELAFERKSDIDQNDIDSLVAFGTDVVTSLCERLLESGAPGLHFYTMNQSQATLEIWRRLNS